VDSGEWLVSGAIEIDRLRDLWAMANRLVERSAHAQQRYPAAPPASAAPGENSAGRLRGCVERVRGADGRAREAQAMELGLLLGAAALCIVCQAFFAASEIALVAADGLKVRAEHESAAQSRSRGVQ